MDKEELLMLNQSQRDRLYVLRLMSTGRLTQKQAAEQLALSVRQIRRIACRIAQQGDAGVVHGLRGRTGNRRSKPSVRRRVLALYRRHYPDFGPTLAAEKLTERGCAIQTETLRRWLTTEGLWHPKHSGQRHRARRERRACLGELLQTDGSHHAWLEQRYDGPVVLLAMIDDATSRLHARFYNSESTENYMDLLWSYMAAYGRPVALYTDRHTIFTAKDRWGQPTVTQFGRACGELGIPIQWAHSPQAKGRVERLFGTLQDRWVKELRLAGAKSIVEANDILKAQLLPEFNRRWTVLPAQVQDAHRPLLRGPGVPALASVLSIREQRSIGNDYTFHYNGHIYQIPPPALPGMRGGTVAVERRLDGTIAFSFQGHTLRCQVIPAGSKGRSKDREPSIRPQPAAARPAATSSRRLGPKDSREPFLPGTNPLEGESWRPGPQHPWRKAILRYPLHRCPPRPPPQSARTTDSRRTPTGAVSSTRPRSLTRPCNSLPSSTPLPTPPSSSLKRGHFYCG